MFYLQINNDFRKLANKETSRVFFKSIKSSLYDFMGDKYEVLC